MKWLLESIESGRREVSETEDFNGQVLSIGGEHIGWKGEWYLEAPRFISYEYFEKLNAGQIRLNDVLLVKDGATIGKVAIANPLPAEEAAVNEHVFLLRFQKENHPRFYFYAFQTDLVQKQIWHQVKGSAQPGLNSEFKNSIILPRPSLESQDAIANFLDRETARIDALIAAKERLLELLAEKRRALITHAVTKGLDPNVPMRDSGIPWLGMVPTHWGVVRLKKLVQDRLEYGANEAGMEDNPDFPRFVRITDIDDEGNLRPDTFKSLPPEVAGPYLLREGDLLFARSGATVGKAFMYRALWGNACFAGYLIRFRCNTELILPDFLFAYTQSIAYWSQIHAFTIQATIQNFSAEKYGEIVLVLPDLKEQEQILGLVRQSLNEIENLRQAARQTIDLLRERRSALIEAAIMGKLNIEVKT